MATASSPRARRVACEEELLRAFEGHVDVHAVVRRVLGDDFGLEERLRRGEGERGKQEEAEGETHGDRRKRR
jgi:hypothetical protein